MPDGDNRFDSRRQLVADASDNELVQIRFSDSNSRRYRWKFPFDRHPTESSLQILIDQLHSDHVGSLRDPDPLCWPAENLHPNSFQCQHPKLFGLRMQVSRFPDLLFPSVGVVDFDFPDGGKDHIGVFPVQVQATLQSETHSPRLDGRRRTPGSGRRSVLPQR